MVSNIHHQESWQPNQTHIRYTSRQTGCSHNGRPTETWPKNAYARWHPWQQIKIGPQQTQEKITCSHQASYILYRKICKPRKQQQQISQTLKNLRNAYPLKWLRPCIVYSRHNNLQEKLLGDLRCKLLWNMVDADLGKCPCNCPRKFKVNGVCAYGGDNSCHTSGTWHCIQDIMFIKYLQMFLNWQIPTLYQNDGLLAPRSLTTHGDRGMRRRGRRVRARVP